MLNMLQGIYASQAGAWAWALHGLTGVGVFVYLLGHIADTSTLGLGPDAYNHALSLWRNPVAKVMEIALLFSVVFHSVNGVRVIIIDFWDQGTKYHRQLFYASVVGTAVLFLPMAFIMVGRVFG